MTFDDVLAECRAFDGVRPLTLGTARAAARHLGPRGDGPLHRFAHGGAWTPEAAREAFDLAGRMEGDLAFIAATLWVWEPQGETYTPPPERLPPPEGRPPRMIPPADRPEVKVRKVDSGRWTVEADDGRFVGLPRLVRHPEDFIGQHGFYAKMCFSRKVAQEAADAWNAGEEIPAYIITGDADREVRWVDPVEGRIAALVAEMIAAEAAERQG